jgi:hypothetical protein
MKMKTWLPSFYQGLTFGFPVLVVMLWAGWDKRRKSNDKKTSEILRRPTK